MANVYEGTVETTGGRFAVVVSRYNESITSKLLRGALDTLTDKGVEEGAIDVAWVPGAWEIPLVTQRMASTGSYAAILCLGAVIRGETTHDRHINRAVSLALANLALQVDLPILFGLLTCDSVEQAIHRAGGSHGNKGSECAEAAIEMVRLLDTLLNSGADETMR